MEFVMLLHILFILSPEPVRSGLLARSLASGSIAKVVQEFPRHFAGIRKNRLENLVTCSLERCPCDAQINPSRTAPKGAINGRGRINIQTIQICRQRK